MMTVRESISRQAIDHLDLYGYCLIEDLIPADQAEEMEQIYYRHHQDPGNRTFLQNPDVDDNQTLFGVTLRDELCWVCIGHPVVLEVVRHFLGEKLTCVGACTKWIKPGAGAGVVHADSTDSFVTPLPQRPWLVNSLWMMSDFSVENGATLVAPFSHKTGIPPPSQARSDHRIMIPVTGRRGSVLLWHAGTWHASGGNTTNDTHRMGLNIGYFAAWYDTRNEEPDRIRREIYERMPPELQKLFRHVVAEAGDEISST